MSRRAQLVAVGAAVALVATAVVAAPAAATAPAEPDRWRGAWSTSLVAPYPEHWEPNWSAGFDRQSLRQVVRATRAGSALRIRVSNRFGTTPLRLGGASVGRAAGGAAVIPGSLRRLTFGRSAGTVVPPGREAVSDAVRLPVAALDRLAVTLWFPAPSGPATFHPEATATAYLAAGDHRGDTAGAPFGETTRASYYLSAVDVAGPGPSGAVVAFGDSITEGYGSTQDADNRYPDELAERLVARRCALAVHNAGVSGNRLLHGAPGIGDAAVDRFRRDALDRPGVRTVIVVIGINDIGASEGGYGEPVTTAELIAGHRALIRAAHARGVRVVGGTMTPTKGTPYPGYHTAAGERMRDAVNRWIRTSGEYDAVVDFERAVADPRDPDRLRAEHDSGDGLHPNDAGHRALAAAVSLSSL